MSGRSFFLQLPEGQERYALFYEAQAPRPLGLLVHASAFGDEMNKSRRMTALAARQFAAHGFAVMQMDHLGCGDSSGEFGQASWTCWIDDLMAAIDWAQARVGQTVPLCLWGLRAGCLLAGAIAQRLAAAAGARTPNLLLWQPVVAGTAVLQQALRMKVAAAMLVADAPRLTVKQLRSELESGRHVETGGYQLSPALAAGLDAACLQPAPRRPDGTTHPYLLWLELSHAGQTAFGPASLAAQDAFQAAGWIVSNALVQGPSFWQSAEIEIAPALLDASLHWLTTSGPAATATPA